MPKITIIGSGFGGLALGIRLLARGFSVTILEKNAKIGGHAYPLQLNGYKFDMGPSLITAPEILQRLFQIAKHDLFYDLDLHKLDPFYRIYFADGSYMDYSDDTEDMFRQIRAFDQKDGRRREQDGGRDTDCG